jgi:hypothetical protein
MTRTVVKATTIVTINLIDESTVTASPILAMMIGIDMIIAAMTDVMTTVAMTATTNVSTTSDRRDDRHDDRHNDRRDDRRDDRRR